MSHTAFMGRHYWLVMLWDALFPALTGVHNQNGTLNASSLHLKIVFAMLCHLSTQVNVFTLSPNL